MSFGENVQPSPVTGEDVVHHRAVRTIAQTGALVIVDLALMWQGPAARRCVWMTPPWALQRVMVLRVTLVAGVTSQVVAVER